MANWTRNCVLVPIDFSKTSYAALDTASAIVDDPSHLHVVTVLPELLATEPGATWTAADDLERVDETRGSLREHMIERGLEDARVHAAVGDPGHVIADTAKEIGADLVVVGSHGRTGISRLFLGSVAERVARLAPCPVLIIRAQK